MSQTSRQIKSLFELGILYAQNVPAVRGCVRRFRIDLVIGGSWKNTIALLMLLLSLSSERLQYNTKQRVWNTSIEERPIFTISHQL